MGRMGRGWRVAELRQRGGVLAAFVTACCEDEKRARAAQEYFHPLDLDAGYSAKAAAALLARRSRYKTPLLWLTYGVPSSDGREPSEGLPV